MYSVIQFAVSFWHSCTTQVSFYLTCPLVFPLEYKLFCSATYMGKGLGSNSSLAHTWRSCVFMGQDRGGSLKVECLRHQRTSSVCITRPRGLGEEAEDEEKWQSFIDSHMLFKAPNQHLTPDFTPEHTCICVDSGTTDSLEAKWRIMVARVECPRLGPPSPPMTVEAALCLPRTFWQFHVCPEISLDFHWSWSRRSDLVILSTVSWLEGVIITYLAPILGKIRAPNASRKSLNILYRPVVIRCLTTMCWWLQHGGSRYANVKYVQDVRLESVFKTIALCSFYLFHLSHLMIMFFRPRQRKPPKIASHLFVGHHGPTKTWLAKSVWLFCHRAMPTPLLLY